MFLCTFDMASRQKGQSSDPVNSQRRSQHTLSNSDTLISGDLHLLSNISPLAPASTWSITSGQILSQTEGEVDGGRRRGKQKHARNFPPHLRPPLSCCTLLSTSQRQDEYSSKQPLLHDAQGWDHKNDQSCPLNI